METPFRRAALHFSSGICRDADILMTSLHCTFTPEPRRSHASVQSKGVLFSRIPWPKSTPCPQAGTRVRQAATGDHSGQTVKTLTLGAMQGSFECFCGAGGCHLPYWGLNPTSGCLLNRTPQQSRFQGLSSF